MRPLTKVALVVLLVSSSASRGEGPTRTLFGRWEFPDVHRDEVTYKTSMVFFHDQSRALDRVMQIVNCVAHDKSVPAHASARVEINSREYSILESASDSEIQAGIPCVASVHPGTTSYRLAPDGSTVEIEHSGQTITLTRKR
jgi:hypothetical protein